MTRVMPLRILTAALVIGLPAFVCPPTAMAQDDAYKRGLEALDKKRWAEAADQMQRAIDTDRNETARRKFRIGGFGPFGGTEFPYLPHYFLGEALIAQNNCAGAVVAYAESERQAVVDGQRLVALREQYQTCAAAGVLAPSAYEPLYRRTSQRYADAMALFKRVSALMATNKGITASGDEAIERARAALDASYKSLNDGTRSRRQADFAAASAAADRGTDILTRLETAVGAAVETRSTAQRQLLELEGIIASADRLDADIDQAGVSLTAPLVTARRNGRSELSRARDGHAAAQQSLNAATLKEALAHARAASTILTDLLTEARRVAQGAADQKRTEAIRAADGALKLAEAAFTSLERRVALETTPEAIATERTRLRQDADGLTRRFARAAKAGDLGVLTQTTQQALDVRTRLDALMQSLPPLSLRARGIPQGLEDGARLYLRGEYQQALAALDTVASPTDPQTPVMEMHLRLFRAAARYALYVRSGETNGELLEQAMSDIERCRQIDSGFVPDTRAFAPRFVELYQRGRPAAGTSSTSR